MSYNLLLSLFCCTNPRFSHWESLQVGSCAFPFLNVFYYLLCEYWLILAVHFCIYKVSGWKSVPAVATLLLTKQFEPWYPPQKMGTLILPSEEQSWGEMIWWLWGNHSGHYIHISLLLQYLKCMYSLSFR